MLTRFLCSLNLNDIKKTFFFFRTFVLVRINFSKINVFLNCKEKFLKGLSGDVHFDDAETFTIGSSSGRNLLWVAIHEIGHSIGLEHSNVNNAIMFPFYKGYKGENFPITDDDILGMQNLYGKVAAIIFFRYDYLI